MTLVSFLWACAIPLEEFMLKLNVLNEACICHDSAALSVLKVTLCVSFKIWITGITKYWHHCASGCLFCICVRLCVSDLLYRVLPLEWGDTVGRPHTWPLSTGDSSSAAKCEVVLWWWWWQAMLPLCYTHPALGHIQKVSSFFPFDVLYVATLQMQTMLLECNNL